MHHIHYTPTHTTSHIHTYTYTHHTPTHTHTTHTHTTSHREIATFFNFAKASIGSGSFALPWGILQCGVILGSFGMVFLGLLRYVGSCSRELREEVCGRRWEGGEETGETI